MLSISASAADCSLVITTLVSSCTLPSGSTSVETAGSVIGSNGSNGSNGANGSLAIALSGGLGTAGSYGVSVSGLGVFFSTSSEVSPAVSGGTGGAGGVGGATSRSNGRGGSGGAGGTGGNGINNSGTFSTFNVSSSVTGGAGGLGGRGGDATGTPGLSGNGGAGGQGGSGIYNTGTITTLTNTGSILGGSGGAGGVRGTGRTNQGTNGVSGSVGYGIYNMTAITTLNNLQGSSSTALSYKGNLPTNYNIIINSTSNFGKLAITAPSGSSTTFGIYTDSTLAAATYGSVLSGVTSSNIANYGSIFNAWNNFNSSYKWQLVQGANLTTWDLVVASLATNMSSGTAYQSSNLGATVNPVFDGGILQVSSAGSITPAFTITANNGVIDQNNVASNFTGNITNSGAGINGKLTIINSGTAGSGAVTLSGINTYSGGTEVQAGANLSISLASNIGSGVLALVGSSTIPATLTTTASMTLNNPITVSGDPTFNVAPGTTTTVSSPIANGVSAGDVVVSGGGTLNLTAINTYTGPTTVDVGSTLALSDAGSIAASSLVTNNGNFNVASKVANVNVANFTQSSTGNLTMNISPGSNQQLIVAGAATLAGGLSLNASPGTYKSGKYALLTAGGVTGSFGSLNSNLNSLTTLGYQLAYDASNVYLIFTPNLADTQQSLGISASSLQNIYTLQNSVLANGLNYDCNQFGPNGICISVGGRNTAVSAANGLNNTSGLLIAAYRPHDHYRVGAFIDQNLSVNNAGSAVNLDNSTPVLGLFAAWNERLDGIGSEVKIAAAYGQKSATVNRQVVGTSEPGSGSSQLNSQGAQFTAKYGFAVMENVIVSPYLGMRYTQNNMGGYTEATSTAVTAPLTYSALNTNATTALAGAGASYRFIPKATIYASAGVESDTNTANGVYVATGISGLAPINFNANPVKTRPTATLGAYYEIESNQRVGVTGIYRQEPYQGVSTTSVMVAYTVGL